VIGGIHALLRNRMTAAASWRWDFLFYATFGVVVTSSVALAGVLLVFSFLIIPAAIGMLHADRLSRQLAIGWISGSVASLAGLAASYAWDLPTGAAMVCAFGVALAVAGLWRARGVVGKMRIGVAAILVLSGLWLTALPRADQPLLDGSEYLFPAMRGIYMTPVEQAAYDESAEQAERYRREGEKLNEREVRSRYEGKQLDAMELGRLASFLKSYGEMRRGEQFVMAEVRSRARERNRWSIGAALAIVGLAVFPWRQKRTEL
jgi:zinc/manganese transport system permease protein